MGIYDHLSTGGEDPIYLHTAVVGTRRIDGRVLLSIFCRFSGFWHYVATLHVATLLMGWVGMGWGGMLTFLVLRTYNIATLLRSLASLTTLHVATLLMGWVGVGCGGMLTFLVLRTYNIATLLRSLVSLTTLHVATLLMGWVGVGCGGMLTFLVLRTYNIATLLRSLVSLTTLHVATLLMGWVGVGWGGMLTFLVLRTYNIATLLRSLVSFTTLHVATLLMGWVGVGWGGMLTFLVLRTYNIATLLRSVLSPIVSELVFQWAWRQHQGPMSPNQFLKALQGLLKHGKNGMKQQYANVPCKNSWETKVLASWKKWPKRHGHLCGVYRRSYMPTPTHPQGGAGIISTPGPVDPYSLRGWGGDREGWIR